MISGALLIASLAAMADNFDCAALSVGGRIFNVKPLDGSLAALDAGSIEHPPSRDSYTLKLSICAALAVSAELPAQDNCEKGAWACLIVTNHKGTPDAPRVTSALQISTVAPTLASDSNSNLSLSFGQGNKTAVITLSCKSKTLDSKPVVHSAFSPNLAFKIDWEHDAGCAVTLPAGSPPVSTPTPTPSQSSNAIWGWISFSIVAYFVVGVIYQSVVKKETSFPALLPNSQIWIAIYEFISVTFQTKLEYGFYYSK